MGAKARALGAGFNHHLTKPIEPTQLLDLIRASGASWNWATPSLRRVPYFNLNLQPCSWAILIYFQHWSGGGTIRYDTHTSYVFAQVEREHQIPRQCPRQMN